MYTPKIGIVLSDDEKAEWLAAAKARRLTLSALIRQAVRKEIESDNTIPCNAHGTFYEHIPTPIELMDMCICDWAAISIGHSIQKTAQRYAAKVRDA